MIYMLDTNIIIYLMKNKPKSVAEKVVSLPKSDKLCMSFITYGELLAGVNGSQFSEQMRQKTQAITQNIPVLYPNAQVCELYGKHYTDLKQKGTPIGSNDLWIACHALSLGATLVTHNTKEFQRIDGLNWQDWTA